MSTKIIAFSIGHSCSGNFENVASKARAARKAARVYPKTEIARVMHKFSQE